MTVSFDYIGVDVVDAKSIKNIEEIKGFIDGYTTAAIEYVACQNVQASCLKRLCEAVKEKYNFEYQSEVANGEMRITFYTVATGPLFIAIFKIDFSRITGFVVS